MELKMTSTFSPKSSVFVRIILLKSIHVNCARGVDASIHVNSSLAHKISCTHTYTHTQFRILHFIIDPICLPDVKLWSLEAELTYIL